MDLLLGCPTLYQNKHLETGVQTAVNSNKIKFEPYDDLVNEACSHCNANMLDKQDPFGQIENGEALYSNDQDDEKRTESIESGKAEQGTKRRVEKEQKGKQNRLQKTKQKRAEKNRLKTNKKEKKTEAEHREQKREQIEI